MEVTLAFPGKTISLNQEQYTAVTRDPSTHQRILASAGSGKTTTLTARIAWLIDTHTIAPNRIVLVTFSRNAAHQMKSRLESLLGPTDVWIGTFHGLSRNLLQAYEPKSLQKLYFVDELVLMGTTWLETPKGKAWAHSIQYIVVDEFQDINASQWRMLERMLHPGARLIVVGDDAQNIYTWRGSNVNFILDLHKKLPGLVDDQLRINYRSSSSIVAAANGVLKHIPSLPWKGTMIPFRSAGPRPEVHFFWRACDEVNWVLKRINELQKEKPHWSFAVLSRTNSDLFRIEEVLQSQGRHYRLRDVFDEITTDHRGKPVLDLVTLHASKGLEWDCVFLIGCSDDVFPARKTAEEIICERRLFYVGVTRAREHLYLSYTKKERALSRFIREIPSTRLLYTGLARYTLSDVDRADGKPRLVDLLSALDGTRLQELRKEGHFQTIERENWIQEQLFAQGLWKVPAWAAVYDKGGDFYRFLRLWVYRYIWQNVSNEEPFHEPALERILFTLRVYAEEREFFEQWRSEVTEMLHTWFSQTEVEPQAVEFYAVKEWAEKKNLFWSTQDIVKATTLLAKLRGQLRPLRFDSYDLNDFRIGSARYIVPTEWRAETLRSWKRVSNRQLHWKDVLVDIWRLGALTLCAEGRNAALYRVIEMSQHLLTTEMIEFFQILETSLGPWISQQQGDGIQFGIELATPDFFTEQLDIVSGGILWRICTEAKQDALTVLELAVRGSLARQEGVPIKAVGWLHPLEGTIVKVPLPEVWDTNVKSILEDV